MSRVIEVLEQQPRLLHSEGCNMKEIKQAELELGISFAPDYVEYLKEFGIVAYRGHELTGLTSSARTNVVVVTKTFWEKYVKIPHNVYVIEDTGYDGLVIWQNSEGKVFHNVNGNELVKDFDSLADFILR